ncbi:paxillin [Heterostelium album PN500]|uniref:Paxillin n=1 Tax=Heterostelium pallidum (strain ATCC 26659 / Pp 5 / PN500) TaxID=670386 RepID=D3B2I6_HETP5|nr:paxillin [Heterostelium album PN500]EFA83534.1 paxillin [Heterostelium album PN500]|eukprot:XP_020435651.1 paxillin [Heterostelium album PN500]
MNQGLAMDDLDMLLADLGRPKSGLKTPTATVSVTVKPADSGSKVNLNEIESLMADLQTSGNPTPVPKSEPVSYSTSSTHDHHHHHHNNNNSSAQQQALDTSDDLDALMESLNSSISTALKSSSEIPKPAAQATTTTSYTSSAKPSSTPSTPVKYTSTATVVTKKQPLQVSKAVLETKAPANQPAAASLSTDDLDELLKNLNPQQPVVDHKQTPAPAIPPTTVSASVSIQHTHQPAAAHNNHNHNHHHDHDHDHHNHHSHHHHHNHSASPAAPRQQEATSQKSKVLAGDDLDNLLSNLTSQMNEIDSSGPTPRGICGGCRKPILGETIQAMGKLFHPEHFQCHNCQNPIGTKNFYEQEGIPHCEKCYQELFCARCAHCDDAITDRCITALGKKWHVHHFVCTQCLKPFEGGNFFEREGRPYCETDFYSTFAARCGGCNQPIRGECINALGTQWHPEHFVCQYCQKSFASGTFFEFGGKPYCDIHYHQQAGSVCSGCGKAVSGRCVDALDKKWHPEHFVCAFCMNPLAGGSYTANNGKPYCKVCHSKLFG